MDTTIPRNTRAWRLQVWLSFLLAVLLCGVGLAWLPGQDLDRAFMVMGYVFCLSTSFALAKFVRDRDLASEASGGQDPHPGEGDTPLWQWVVWGGFALAMGLTAWGLWRMAINPTWKAYLLVSWLYLISSAFTLAKTLRDDFEARRASRHRQAAVAPAEAPATPRPARPPRQDATGTPRAAALDH